MKLILNPEYNLYEKDGQERRISMPKEKAISVSEAQKRQAENENIWSKYRAEALKLLIHSRTNQDA